MISYLKRYKGFDVVLFFLANEGKKYSINQICRSLKIAPNTSEIICKALYNEDFLNKEIVGKSHLYSLNSNNIDAVLLKKITFPYILNTTIILDFLKNMPEKTISVYIYGSCSNGNYDTKSDIDIFLLTVNKLDKDKYYSITQFFDSFLYGRKIQLATYSLSEFKKLKNNPFLKEIKKGIKIYGEII